MTTATHPDLRPIAQEEPTALRPGLQNMHSVMYDMPLNPNLNEDELLEALILRDYARGTMAVTGPPGAGKTQFDIWLAGKLYKYFYRPIVADFHATPEFIAKVDGNFTFIDEDIFLEQLKEVDALAKRHGVQLSNEDRSQWMIDGKVPGSMKLRGCTLVFDEPDRWTDARRTSSNTAMVVSDLFKRWRHYDMLVVMSTPDIMDLDRKRVVKRFTAAADCEALVTEPNFEDYCYLCAAQGLEPDPDEFLVWYQEALGNYLLGDYQALWFRYRLTRKRRVTLGSVIDEMGSDTITVFGPNFWKYFWTDQPSAGRSAIMKRKNL